MEKWLHLADHNMNFPNFVNLLWRELPGTK